MTISAEYKSKFAAGDVSIWMKNSRVEQTNKQTNNRLLRHVRGTENLLYPSRQIGTSWETNRL